VLIAYDGSDVAGHAVDEAARLFPGARAVLVVHPRDPLDDVQG
jgi:hypothetical protein